MKPIIVLGLSGSGKEEFSAAMCAGLNALHRDGDVQVVDTNEWFRKLRAIPYDASTPDAEVINNFLGRAGELYPADIDDLISAAGVEPNDAKGRSKLHDSNFFRARFGEDIFRLFEIEMIKWLYEKGEFDGKIVEPSSAALMAEETKALFSDNGFIFILVDTPADVILEKLVSDYKEHERLSKEKAELVPIRGGYEKLVREALAQANHPQDDMTREEIIKAALSKEAEKQATRLQAFHSFDPIVVPLEAKHYINAPAGALDFTVRDTIKRIGLIPPSRSWDSSPGPA